MKTILIVLGLLMMCSLTQARDSNPAVTVANSTMINYIVGEQDANSRVWQKIVRTTDKHGNTSCQTNQAYVELATGLNFWQDGRWNSSREKIEISADGSSAFAINGQHQAYFPGNIYNGVIKLVMPDGKMLRSQPIGLSYFDGNKSVFLAVVTNSTGAILPSGNQVIYTNAFDTLNADLLYTYTKAGFEQDVILRQQPPDPASLGLNPQTTRLQVLTEFLSPPQPGKRATTVPTPAGELEDDSLNFGGMQMGEGKAFSIGTKATTVRVNKRWLVVKGRQFLIEEVPILSVAAAIDDLPPFTQTSSGTTKPILSKSLILPPPRLVHSAPRNTFVAEAKLPRNGLVLDYVTLNCSTNNFTFRGDTTYYISGVVNLTGTNTFEGGAVLKYATNASIFIQPGQWPPQVNWVAGPFRPVIITASDDNSVGDTISGSTGFPTNYYANVALGLSTANLVQPISNFRIAYALQAVQVTAGNYSFYNGQILNCQNGFAAGGASSSLRNVLFSDVQTNLNDLTSTTIKVQNCSFDSSSNLTMAWYTGYQTASAIFTNCVFADIPVLTNNSSMVISGSFNGFYNCTEFGAGAVSNTFYPFQSAGAGNYYLANGCNFLAAGTANIDPVLLAQLQAKTTYPPVIYSNVTFSSNLTLGPQAQRDTGTPPTLGYHYDPIDYLVDQLWVTNAVLTVSNGAVLASYNESGIELQNGSSIVSFGSPQNPDWFVRYSSVQEAPILLGGTNVASGITVNIDNTATLLPSGLYRFTKFACPAGGGYLFKDSGSSSYSNLVVQDCELWSGFSYFGGTTNTVTILINNLFDRSYFNQYCSASNTLSLSNNLIFGTTVFVENTYSIDWAWSAFNNAFDSCSIYYNPYNNTGHLTADGYNAYLNCTGLYGFMGELWPTNATDLSIANTLAYQTGSFGTFYQPANSPLINMGSTTADQVGLYHYTVTTNEIPEGTNIVSIGYHYVATDAYGNPLDSNGDGIPDYLEDANGNGIVDNGEANWALAILTQPQNQTAIQGSNAIFSVTVGGIPPIQYQWYFNSIAIANATNATLTLNDIETNIAGNYFVVVANGFGSITSSAASLTVIIVPTLDSDYDGRNDNQEIGDGTDPFNPNSVLQVSLAYFPFDDTNLWSGSAGQLPLVATNIVGVPSWSSNAVLIDNTNGAVLTYRDVETNGNANINLRAGTIRFWFNPDWNSTTLLLSNAVLAGGNFSFSITGAAGGAWNVYSSTNLTTWTNIGSVTLNSSGYNTFTDTTAAAFTSCFYHLSNSNYISPAIGFEQISIGPGTPANPGTSALLANQLLALTNTLDGLFNPTMPNGAALPVGTMIQKWVTGTQAYSSYYTWTNNQWIDTNGNPAGYVTLNPGEGAYLINPTASLLTVTFAGLVSQGNLSLSLAAGQSNLVSSMLPQSGGLTTSLGYLPSIGDTVLMWNGSNYNSYIYTNSAGGGTNYWFPSEPVLSLGQAAFIVPATNNTWQVNFGQSPVGSGGRFIEVGSQTSPDWWALMLDLNGDFISLVTQTNGMQMNNLSAPINWTSNTWHQVAITYSTNSSALYIDGSLAANGLGTVYWPRPSIRANGFNIGGSASGMNQARGVFDELQTFNYPLDAQTIWSNYVNSGYPLIIQSPTNVAVSEGNPASFKVTALGTSLTYQWQHNGVSMPGQTASTFSLNSAQTNDAGTYTVVVANGVKSANASAGLLVLHVQRQPPAGYQVFTLFGPTSGDFKYDIYIRPSLSGSVNWRLFYRGDWGQTTLQCPNPTAQFSFFVAGSALDSDGDGLSDGYEKWVSQTDWAATSSDTHPTDTDGDGMPDGWEAMWGTYPTVPDATVSYDNDPRSNLVKYKNGIDPWPYNTNPYSPRPIVSVSQVNGAFVITNNSSTSQLTVNFAVGGTAVYGQDYTLTSSAGPNPGSTYPFSVTIPAGSSSITLTPTGLPAGKTVLIGIIPFSQSDYPNPPGPAAWAYVVGSATDYGDTDGDGLANALEASFNCNPFVFDDVDQNGVPDWRQDSTGDGLPDSYKRMVGVSTSTLESPPVLPTYSTCPIP
jgi:hypothetical protein